MTGDFSRMTFDKNKHFLRVLMQQGRVQLDSDWNEQVAILLHYLQTVVKDIIGPYGGPEKDDGFKIIAEENNESLGNNFKIRKGRYYVDGILVENENDVWYRVENGRASQPNISVSDDELGDGPYLVYLDVWERHITYIQDDDIREKALGGADTTTRTKVVWQVKVEDLNEYKANSCKDVSGWFVDGVKFKPARVQLSARTNHDQVQTGPCTIDPESRYRGAENQLYRVEIHNVESGIGNLEFTFKWSRDNGSVVFPVKEIILKDTGSDSPKTIVELEHLGRDSSSSLSEGDWVEFIDDDYTLMNKADSLLKVSSVDRENMEVKLEGSTVLKVVSEKHPFLRRWDHKETEEISFTNNGADSILKSRWVELENGIEIQFEMQNGSTVRSGDYWLIPARTATGDVEWPKKDDKSPRPMPPHGIVHHYAPLAIISVEAGKVSLENGNDCRCSFGRRSHCPWDSGPDDEK